jgi:glycine dehydrogenase subunit 1
LTDMDVANASLFDGGSAMIEGVMMALRHTRRNKVIVDEGASPIYRKMLKTYTNNLSVDYEEISIGKNGVTNRDLFFDKLDDSVGAVVFQNPNFFGCLDDFTDLIEKTHEIGALVVMSVYPMSLSFIQTPGAMGVDIVTGEGQSLGLPLNFGGPYLGFFAAKKELVRKMPGRIVGETEDINGKRGFVLTLQAREQHIRREKATSNICSNVQVCALRAIIYLSLVGREGFQDVGRECMDRANYAWNRITSIEGISPAFNRRFFNEFAIRLPISAKSLVNNLIDEGIAGGFPVSKYYENMENVLLIAFTEKRTKEEIDIFATKIESVIKGI